MRVVASSAEVPFLPPQSLDFHPIEVSFFELKVLLRNAAERTIDGCGSAIRRIIETGAPQECGNCLPQLDMFQADRYLLEVPALTRKPNWITQPPTRDMLFAVCQGWQSPLAAGVVQWQNVSFPS